MLALAKVDANRGLSLIERPEPMVNDGHDVLIEVGACGICGSDLDTYLSEDRMISLISRYGWPRILGHEIAGIVREVGKEVTDFKSGDRVASDVAPPCGFCFFCSRGNPNLCDNTFDNLLGIGMDGGYARYVLVTPHYLFKLPDTVTFEEAAMLEPVGVAVRAMERSNIKPGDTAVIIGPGPLGILAAMLLKRSGIQTLIVAGRHTSRKRLKIAGDIGAITVEIKGDNLKEKTLDLTGGLGADVVFDFAGGSQAMAAAVNVVRKGGEIVMVGVGLAEGFDQNTIMMKELTVLGSVARVHSTWQRAINLVSNRALDLNRVITHVLPLEESEKAFQLLLERKALKVILVP
ncbi:zinc-binding dehydrogenase [Chloroflexota bacterium]